MSCGLVDQYHSDVSHHLTGLKYQQVVKLPSLISTNSGGCEFFIPFNAGPMTKEMSHMLSSLQVPFISIFTFNPCQNTVPSG